MNENQVNPNNLLDATDCLEAIGVFRGWKNFLFVIMILSLLLTQTCFWLVNTGYIPASSEGAKSDAGVLVRQDENLTNADEDDVPRIGAFADNVAMDLDEPVESNDTESSLSDDEEEAGPLFGMTFRQLSGLLRFVNAILVLTASLYCLTLLFSLKISLLGRLGGINHICRAFFLSLLMLILLLPWHFVYGPLILGAFYTPGELVSWLDNKSSGFGTILYYLRFCGYWLLILLILFLSQLRSSRWARAILRRLEII